MGVASLRRAGFGGAGGGASCAGGGAEWWCGSSTWKLRSATSKASAASTATRLFFITARGAAYRSSSSAGRCRWPRLLGFPARRSSRPGPLRWCLWFVVGSPPHAGRASGYRSLVQVVVAPRSSGCGDPCAATRQRPVCVCVSMSAAAALPLSFLRRLKPSGVRH